MSIKNIFPIVVCLLVFYGSAGSASNFPDEERFHSMIHFQFNKEVGIFEDKEPNTLLAQVEKYMGKAAQYFLEKREIHKKRSKELEQECELLRKSIESKPEDNNNVESLEHDKLLITEESLKYSQQKALFHQEIFDWLHEVPSVLQICLKLITQYPEAIGSTFCFSDRHYPVFECSKEKIAQFNLYSIPANTDLSFLGSGCDKESLENATHKFDSFFNRYVRFNCGSPMMGMGAEFYSTLNLLTKNPPLKKVLDSFFGSESPEKIKGLEALIIRIYAQDFKKSKDCEAKRDLPLKNLYQAFLNVIEHFQKECPARSSNTTSNFIGSREGVGS